MLLNKINIYFHSIIFGWINSKLLYYNFFYRNSVFSKWVVIDPRKTFKRNFPENKKFSFIQIGGNDGVSFDFLYSEVMKRESKGLILEPSPKYFEELKFNYKDLPSINLVRKAIYTNNSLVKLYEVNSQGLKKIPDWGKGVGSIDKAHLTNRALSDDDINVVEVEGITFMDLLENFPEFYSINYLQIDTEGFDFEILKLIDFSRFQCDFIRYEKANLSLSDLQGSEELLISNGYQILGDEHDNFCFRTPLTYQLKYHRN